MHKFTEDAVPAPETRAGDGPTGASLRLRRRVPQNGAWKVLIVDDEEDVHNVTRLVLRGSEFDGRPIEFFSARSELEARALLCEHPDAAVVLLDLVMETDDAGLSFIEHVRKDLGNRLVRIVVRTGQPGAAPEGRVILDYDITDYREKSDLTATKLLTSVIGSLRSYRDMVALDERTAELERTNAELREVYDELTRTKAHLDLIVSSLPSALVSIDEERRITHANVAAYALAGPRGPQLVGADLFAMFPFLEPFRADVDAVLATARPAMRYRQVIAEDPVRYADILVHPLQTPPSRGAIVRMDDITELEIKKRHLERMQKLEIIATLASGMAHDLNNALGGIIGIVDILRNSLRQDRIDREDSLELTEIIREAAMGASNTVHQVLGLAKRDTTEHTLVDLNYVLSTTERICRTSFDRRIEIRTEPCPGEALVLANPSRLEQALLNLCVNAAHAMTLMREPNVEYGGELTIAVGRIGPISLPSAAERIAPYFRMSVTDTGVGIDKKIMDQIFEPFFTTKAPDQGTGLGLSMVESVVRGHGGFIEVTSEPGRGSRFDVYLPCAADPKSEEAPPLGS